jgi:hypothetical protein
MPPEDKEVKAKKEEKRTKIVIDEHLDPGQDQMNTDVFVGVNGRGYLIKRGVTADVPDEVLHVLNNAVQTVYVEGPNGQEFTRDVPRFNVKIIKD